MTEVEERAPEEGRDDKELSKVPFEVSWIADVLKNGYIDGEVPQLKEFATSLDNPVLREVTGLDPQTIRDLKNKIEAECDTRTITGFKELLLSFGRLDHAIRVHVDDRPEGNGYTHTTLEGFELTEDHRILPVSRDRVLEGKVVEVRFRGEAVTI